MFEIQLVADHALLQTVKLPLICVAAAFLLLLIVTAVLVRSRLRAERARIAETSGQTDACSDAPNAEKAE